MKRGTPEEVLDENNNNRKNNIARDHKGIEDKVDT